MRAKWSYGITTVLSRRHDLLPRTLASLCSAGFPEPRLFVDGADAKDAAWYASEFGLPVTARYPAIRTFGNWFLSLAELYIREPTATRYAVFQDDFVTYRNLRQYLESCEYPPRGYWNLYTFPSNQTLAKGLGWYASNQFGRGAVALVFDRETVKTLLASQHMVERPEDCTRGWRAVDGGVVTALKKAGWTEYVHNPSLTQHTGQISSMGNRPHLQATSFRGEEYDALELQACMVESTQGGGQCG
jgi:hypothetical protein